MGSFSLESRSWTAWPFSRPSWFGLIGTKTYVVVLIPVWVMFSSLRPAPMGLVVHLVRPGIPAQHIAGLQPLRVRVAAAIGDARPRVYVDSQPVPLGDFRDVLEKRLILRPPDWPVYFEGDRDMEWDHAMRAIDTIRGLHAQVVLLTPSILPKPTLER